MRTTGIAMLCVLGSCRAFTTVLPTVARQANRVGIASRYAGMRTLAMAASEVQLKPKGETNTEEFRLFFTDKGGKEISPWHDIPLSAGGELFNFLCEIPKYGLAKMECATKEAYNPICQDIKKGKLRFYHGPIFWNYGYLPQTWEDPNVKHPELGCMGDGDPVDVVEIGSKKLGQGELVQVKPLGCLAMIDDGELDWKVIAISTSDPMAEELNDITDVEAKMPGVISGIREWFRWYKTPDDKPLNAFGFGEKALSKAETLKIIEECNHHWDNLMNGKTEKGKMWTK